MKGLTPDQNMLLEKVKKESKKRADEVLRRAKLSSDQESRLGEAKERLQHATIAVNLSLRRSHKEKLVVDGILEAKRILNLFEIGDAATDIHDYYFRTRFLVEFKLYGATSDLQPLLAARMFDSDRPNYAALDYVNDNSHSLLNTRGYGVYRFILKQELKTRATFTAKDSFYVEREEVYVWDDVEGVLATRPRPGEKFWFEHVLDDTEPRELGKGKYFIETQILGGVYLTRDVETLYYPPSDMFDQDFLKKLRQFEVDHHIRLVQYK